MLAEIFMVRLEARARCASDTVLLGNRRFVALVRGDEVAFKERKALAAGRFGDVAKDRE
jgi:hypothetical protein